MGVTPAFCAHAFTPGHAHSVTTQKGEQAHVNRISASYSRERRLCMPRSVRLELLPNFSRAFRGLRTFDRLDFA
jgi:hypothetical protein